MIRLIKRRTSRMVVDIFLPIPINVRGEEIEGQLRLASVVESISTSSLSIDESKVIGHEFLFKGNWEKMDKSVYETIMKLAKGWEMLSVGIFKKEEKIIGISFK